MQKLLGPVVVVLLWGVPVVGRCQSVEMPTAPSAPAVSAPVPGASGSVGKPSFALPAPTYERPTGPTLKKDYSHTCFAPEEGLYSGVNLTAPTAMLGEMHSYAKLLASQVFSEWDHSMPKAARGAWSPSRYVALRFVVMADGSYSTPVLTVSSGKELYDGLALTAVRSHASFPPLPAGMDHPFGMCLKFGYNMGGTGLDYFPHDHTNANP